MFQDTLLIIKPDFLSKRKALLLYLLREEFIIKGQRKTCFSPELAAEFYKDRARHPSFMFYVILLSKGNSEAFILAKEGAVKELVNLMVCYFGTSTVMERNIHVTQCPTKVQSEINFIFPNYIFDQISYPDEIKFCNKNPLVESTILSLYDMTTKPEYKVEKNWKMKLAEALVLKNIDQPLIANQCSHTLRFNTQNIGQQTKVTCLKNEKRSKNTVCLSSSSEQSKECSSLNVTSSSCITCSSFGSGAECVRQTCQPTLGEIIKARTAPLNVPELSRSSHHSVQEELEEDLGAEENIVPKDFSVFVVDQVFYDFQLKKEVRIDDEEMESSFKDVALFEAKKMVELEIEEKQPYSQDVELNEAQAEMELEKKVKESDFEDAALIQPDVDGDDLKAEHIPIPEEPELNPQNILDIDEAVPPTDLDSVEVTKSKESQLSENEGTKEINKEDVPLSGEVIAADAETTQ